MLDNNGDNFLGNQKKNVLFVTGIMICISLMVGVSYAWWTSTSSQSTSSRIASDCLELGIADVTNAISLDKAYPIIDAEADSLPYYEFKVTNKCSTSVLYDVELDIMEPVSGDENRLKSEYIAMKFVDPNSTEPETNGTNKVLLNTVESVTPSYNKSDYRAVEGRRLASGSLDAKAEITYKIKLWMDKHVTVQDNAMNKEFISKIVVNTRLDQMLKYKESILNGADPVLKGDLVPVVISDTGTVTKANTQEKWYSYENKKWANAVILFDKSATYTEGQTIPEDNIESYFVWIPKYKYKLWNIGDTPGEPREIEIVFGTENTKDETSGECTTPGWNESTKEYDGSNVSGANGSCDVGEYMTHPAFISMGTNGLWVGKFETGNNGGNIQIKPNVSSWRSINISTMYTTSYNYNRDLDSHMMKNTEWGSVAYLTNSKYGRCENGTCTEITTNSNSSYITGMTDTTEYFSGSVLASTTGNYTGIYDVNGGAWEYTMGVMKDLDGNSMSSLSGFTTFPDARYMDVYNYGGSDNSAYQRRILGDATAETKGWYGELTGFVIRNYPWFMRGGSYGGDTRSGAWVYFYSNDDNSGSNHSFRVILAR